MRFVFKNLEHSELAKEIAGGQIQGVLEKFPEISPRQVAVTLSMENSMMQPGEDCFGVKFQMHSQKIGRLVIEKRASSLYLAVSNVKDVLLERLNRANDRKRLNERKKKRQYKEETRATS